MAEKVKTGHLIMVEHPVHGWLPATNVPCYPRGEEDYWYGRWPEPEHMWQAMWCNSEIIGWIKRQKRAPHFNVRTGHEKPCEVCGTIMYVTASREKKRFCSKACQDVQLGRERLKGLVF